MLLYPYLVRKNGGKSKSTRYSRSRADWIIVSSSFDSFHDQDFDALEAHLDNLPPARQHYPYLTSRFEVWRLGRQLAKRKKREGESFSEEVSVGFRQPLSASGGWLSFGGPVSPELLQAAKDLVTERFDKRGLSVSDFTLGFNGMYDGPEGTYQSLSGSFTVT